MQHTTGGRVLAASVLSFVSHDGATADGSRFDDALGVATASADAWVLAKQRSREHRAATLGAQVCRRVLRHSQGTCPPSPPSKSLAACASPDPVSLTPVLLETTRKCLSATSMPPSTTVVARQLGLDMSSE